MDIIASNDGLLSVGRFPLKKEDLKGIYSSLGDVFFLKKTSMKLK